MIVLHSDTVILVTSLICLVSAYSTRFIMEGEDEGIKTATEIKTQKMEENKHNDIVSPEKIAVKVIPIMTNMFTQTEDLFHLTPLKLVTAIAAQHLLDSVRNIPVAGSTAQDTLDMLAGIVKELNKTAEIIKLTAEYVNISGNYILATLDQFVKTDCQQSDVEKQMKQLKENFLQSITDHVLGSVKELNEKTKQREITGSDILISSAYHIVAAFQEITNHAVAATSVGLGKCSKTTPKVEITHPSDEVMNGAEIKSRFTVNVVPEQGKHHKSIKKDQATPQNEHKSILDNSKDQMTTEHLNNNQDKTVELFLPGAMVQNGNKPDVKIGVVKTTEHNDSFDNFQDQMTIENMNNIQDKTVEVFSPEAIVRNGKKPSATSMEKLDVPEGLKIEYVPFKTISLFETPKKEEGDEKSSVGQEKGLKEKNNMVKENIDKELASSIVDSLSNVPWSSEKGFEKMPETAKTKDTSPNVANLFDLLSSGYNKPLVNQPKGQEGEIVEPVCGVDKSSKKFIFFLNDQKREAHNNAYGTNYVSSDMETCISFLVHSPSLYSVPPNNNLSLDKLYGVDLRPR